MSRVPGVFPISANYEVNIAEPLDARSRVSLQADLIAGEIPYPYNGMMVTVYGDSDPLKNGTYWLKDASNVTLIASWKKLDAPETTDELEEGIVNLYFTPARARQSISAVGDFLQYNNTTGALSTSYTPENAANKGVAGGYVPLNISGKINTSYLPDSVLGNLRYGGTYNGTVIAANMDLFPELNGVDLPSTAGYTGIYFISTANFTRTGVDYVVGDWVVHNGGGVYVKVDNSDAITSFNGRIGPITLVSGDVTDALGFTPINNLRTITINGVGYDLTANRAWTLTTADISEGGGFLYYNDTRARAALSFAAGSGAYNSSTGVITIPTDTIHLANSAGYLTFYNETDTLASVTGRGAVTSTALTFNGGFTSSSGLVTGAFTIQPTGDATLTVRANTSGNTARILFNNGASSIWALFKDSTVADFRLYNYNLAAFAMTVNVATNAFTFGNSITATSIIRSGGTSAQFLKADGSIDTSAYITAAALSGYATESWVNTALTNYYTLTQIQNFFSGASAMTGYSKVNWDAVYAWYQSGPLTGLITAAHQYYIGTTLNALNRASGAQTLTGVSIDGNAGTATLAANSTLLQGYSAVVASTANTIALRDGNGYLRAVYFYDDNTSVASSGITSMYGGTGDKYMYKFSAAAVQAFLGLGSAAYINASQSAVVNTIAQRTNEADIFVRLLRTEWTGGEAGTGGYILMQNAIGAGAVDNYARPTSMTTLRGYMNLGDSDSTYMRYQGSTLDANTMLENRTGFTYASNAPYTGPILYVGAAGYGLQLNATYSGGGELLAFRTRNGDTATWNGWNSIWHEGNFTPGSYVPYSGATTNVNLGSWSLSAYNLTASNSVLSNDYYRTSGTPMMAGTSTYTLLYSQTGTAAIYLGGAIDPANYYDNTTHFFRNIGGGATYATIQNGMSTFYGETQAYNIDNTNRTTYRDILYVSAQNGALPYTGHGGGILFRGSTYQNNGVNVPYARIGTIINSDSVNTFGSTLFFDIATNSAGSTFRAFELYWSGRGKFFGGLDVEGARLVSSWTSPGPSYTQATTEIYSSGTYGPRLSLHWGGVVASQIGVEASGRIAILNNPGTSYEAFVAGAIISTGDFVGSSHGTFAGRTRVGGGYIADIGGTGNSTGIGFGSFGIYSTDGAGNYAIKNLGHAIYPWGVLYSGDAIRRTTPLGGYLHGGYAGVETTTTPGLIYSIGDGYIPTSSALAAMYGIGYTHNQFAGNPMGASGWGLYVADAGNMRHWLGSDAYRTSVPIVNTSGSASSFSGNITAASMTVSAGGTLGIVSGDLWIMSNGGFGILSANAARAIAIQNTQITLNYYTVGVRTHLADNGSADYVFKAAASNTAGTKYVLLAGVTGVTNGFTVTHNGTNMVYHMANGGLTVNGGITANDTLTVGPNGGSAAVQVSWTSTNNGIVNLYEGGVLRGQFIGSGDSYLTGAMSANYFDAVYSSSYGSYNGSFDWNVLQLGNNGPNYIVGGHTVTGGWLDFYTNNTNRVPGTTPNGTHVMRMNVSGRVDVYNTVTAPNFADFYGSYNVNLGSGGLEGRGLVAGYSGGSYAGIGYNVRHTSSSGVYIAPLTDYSVYLTFNQGFTFSNDTGGASGRTVAYRTLANIDNEGGFGNRGGIFPGYNNGSYGGQNSYYLYSNIANQGIRTNGNFLVNGDVYVAASGMGVWLSGWLNQSVRTDASPQFVGVYATDWFRNLTTNTGLYNQANNTHFSSSSVAQWDLAGSQGSYVQLALRVASHGSTIRGYLYADSSNNIGFLGYDGNWALRMDQSKNLIGSAGSTFTYDITTSAGQGRFGGWYTGAGFTGPAVEVGYSGGEGSVIGYNRNTAAYIPLNLQGGGTYLRLSGDAIINTTLQVVGGYLYGQSASSFVRLDNSIGSQIAYSTWSSSVYDSGGAYIKTNDTIRLTVAVGTGVVYTHAGLRAYGSGSGTTAFSWDGGGTTGYTYSDGGGVGITNNSNFTLGSLIYLQGGEINFYSGANSQVAINTYGLRMSTNRGITDGGFYRILNPGNATYNTSSSSITGAIKIRMPMPGTGPMIMFNVNVYEHVTGKSFTVKVSGHTSGGSWYNTSAYVTTDIGNDDRDINVRFGSEAGSYCIWIGETGYSWSCPQVWITDVQVGFSAYSAGWATDWVVSFETALGSVTSTRTAYATSGSSGGNRIVRRDGNGYIINSYFNTSSGGAERNASGMGYFAGFNSSDYYIRSYTPTAARLAMGLGTGDNVVFNQVTATLIGISSGVTVNYNNDSASTYQMLWGSGNYVYGTAGIYCNPNTDWIYAARFSETSDRRLKELITENILVAGIENITPHLYRKKGAIELGYFAQDVKPLLSHAVTVGADGKLTLTYRDVFAAKIYSVEVRTKNIETETEGLKKRVSELERRLSKYENIN